MSRVPEIVRPAPRPDKRDREEREDHRRHLDGLNVVLPDSPLAEGQIRDNVLVLASGDHGGGRFEAPHTRVLGLAGPRIVRLLVLRADAILAQVHFVSTARHASRNNRDVLVRIENAARVVLLGCTFEKDVGDPMSAAALDRQCFVVVESGAKAEFVGCMFRGVTTTAGLVVNHVAGPVGDVHIIGCVNRTGQPHGNVTTIAEVT